MSETIFAPLTLKGNCSIYVVRISGNKVKDCLNVFGIKELEHRNATLCKLRYANEIIDEALVIYFKAPNSFTGEDVCELNLHCSSYIIKKVFEILASVEGVRFADRGEFSKRAFLNGKIDLMQAESILDLINSETELQHKQAINQLQGKNSKFYNTLREQVVKVLSLLEAYIDFPDEHLPEENLKKQVEEITAIVEKNLSDEKVGERIRDGFKIAIIGEPNVGKSTLLNYLAKRDVAIVSDIAGTTRDIIEVHLDINGIPVILYDTAGIRETTDKIEFEGVKRAIGQAENADLKVLLLSPDNMNPNAEIMRLVDEKTIIIVNKCDLAKINDNFANVNKILISLKNNTNIDIFISKLQDELEKIISPNIDTTITNERYRNELKQALFYLKVFDIKNPLEICAENMRIIAKHIGNITGKIGVEELLDNIFSKFCIGK
ncbi:MAG: tRNA uridine-5-carboxymethylaminomethyl(34) synthesis GTPase MnmE [Rickettsiales bacterium]|nr:MAG: tRNA uridine-5-carboxymethylaminomethyl(34) synthesis GTPase MnmE [Rickettsiales bacterium]